MDPERWQAVNRIFHAAVEMPHSERPGYVTEAADGDSLLRFEVERLLAADELAGDYLESPLLQLDRIGTGEPPLKPGMVLARRFRLVDLLGEGGMGCVYQALDLELNVMVALKVIRPELAWTREAEARFRQEVRLARGITDRNVCRIYDLNRGAVDGTGRDFLFLTMELLAGETLATRLLRGRIGPERAHGLARQIAAGLGAAHARGVVHRDIKPANLHLVSSAGDEGVEERVVITDFGLARVDPAATRDDRGSLTSEFRPLGTLAYMAPEQLEGKPVSAATDVYAFGLVLFEMVTGTRAFPSRSLLSGIAKRLKEPSVSVRSLVPELPPEWEAAIEGCLRLDPRDRLQSTGAVIEILDGDRTMVSVPASGGSDPGWFRRHAPWVRRGFVVGAGTAMAVVALLLGTLRLYRLKTDSRVSTGALVYMAPVQNHSEEPDMADVAELMRAGLAQSPQIELVDPVRVGDILQQMTRAADTAIDASTAREIAMRAGAVRVIFPSVSGANGKYRLDVDIQQPDNTPSRYRDHWTNSFAWQTSPSEPSKKIIPPGLLAAVRRSSDWIRHEAGESANDIARLDVPPEDVTTSSWEALEDYTEGEHLAQSLDHDDAITAFQSATQADPHFSLAYARMGDALLNSGRASEGYGAYQKALGTGSDQRLSLRERDRIKGYYALDTWNYDGAARAFSDYLLYYPLDYTGHVYLAYAVVELGRLEEGIEEMKKAYALDPKRSVAPEHLALYLLYHDDLNGSRYWSTVLGQTSHPEEKDFIAALQFFSERRYDEAGKSLLGLTKSESWFLRSLGYTMLTRLAAEKGEYTAALDYAQRGYQEDLAGGSRARQAAAFLDRASLYCQIQSFDACLRNLEQAIEVDASPRALLFSGTVLGESVPASGPAHARMLREIIELQRKLPDTDGNIYGVARLHLHGEELLAKGDARGALSAFQDAAAMDSVLASHEAITRAALAAAQYEKNPSMTIALEKLAFEACLRDAEPSGDLWKYSYFEPPGYLANRLHSLLALAHLLGVEMPAVRAAGATMQSLQPTPDGTPQS